MPAKSSLRVQCYPNKLVKAPVVFIHNVASTHNDEMLRLATAIEMVDVVVHAQRNRGFGLLGEGNLGGIHADGLEANLDHGLHSLGGESVARERPWR